MSDAKVFNLSLETASQYNLCRFVDRSAQDRTSDKLRSSVLFFETRESRYEIAMFTNKDYVPSYRLAEVKEPFYKDEDFYQRDDVVIPLDVENMTEVLGENLDWDDFLWGVDSLKVNKIDKKVGPILNFCWKLHKSAKPPQKIPQTPPACS